MQLNTLNRVVAIFLVGGFGIALVAFSFESDIRGFLIPYARLNMGAPIGVFLAVALLSVTVLVGSVIDAVGNVVLRRVIRKFGETRSRARLLLCEEEFDEQERWRKAFEHAVEANPSYAAYFSERPTMIRPLSAGLFFRSASKELAEWLNQHHSMYHLSTNFAVVVIWGGIWCVSRSWYYPGIASLAVCYLLMTFALDNYLYTYHLAFRNAYLVLTLGTTEPISQSAVPPA